ncbi:hypothetical protein [Mycobacterium sp. IS-1496]|uniref:hypothetical protein n=1 Tax=Mycobacterium sp. IS-1496 TaxID=1772284 RepID=UPI0025707956|nr:hypothetical protein [Mycobacterium sp. IS-1496]
MLATAACSSTPYPTGENFTTTVQSPPDGAAKTSSAPTPSAVLIDIDISNGAVEPRNATLTAAVGQRVELRVDSDAEGRIHIGTNPAQTFNVAARDDQVFGFTADEPGAVTVVLIEPDRTVATVQVGR